LLKLQNLSSCPVDCMITVLVSKARHAMETNISLNRYIFMVKIFFAFKSCEITHGIFWTLRMAFVIFVDVDVSF